MDMFKTAIGEYGREREALRSLAEKRYDTGFFPTVGQYDWFSGQALYCLVRHLKPESIVEISTSSGYSTLFMGLAMKENRAGRIDTFELDPRAAAAAGRNFARWGVDSHIRVHVGDAMKNVGAATGVNASILFLDSLHTEAFARWFVERFVLGAPRDALFHMHDIMPPDARVRKFGGPPFPAPKPIGWAKRMKNRIGGRVPTNEELMPGEKNLFPPGEDSPLQTYDGNDTTEARFGNMLAGKIEPTEKVYCHNAADRFPELEPREYDSMVKGRMDRFGNPREWNESLWTYCGSMAVAYAAFGGGRP